MSSPPAARTSPVPRPQLHHPPTMAFVDAKYLERAACRALGLRPTQQRLDVARVRDWLRDGLLGSAEQGECERVLWYDGAFDAAHPRADAQRRFLHAIGQLDLVQTRLGYLSEITPQWQHDVRRALDACGVEIERFEQHCSLSPTLRQKGVDTTLAIDLVRIAERGAIGHALLLVGDSDFAPAIEVARDAGVLITILTPELSGIAGKLRELADRAIEIPSRDIAALLRGQPARTPAIRAAQNPSGTGPQETFATPTARGLTRRPRRGGRPDRPALHAVPHAAPAAPRAAPSATTDPAAIRGGGRPGLERNLEEMLVTVRHLCDQFGLDYGTLDRRAYTVYSVELADRGARAEQKSGTHEEAGLAPAPSPQRDTSQGGNACVPKRTPSP
jgi:uncharacterized LabA/DUF88 family protein